MRAIVVKDGAGAVDDLLAVIDLRRDRLLYLKRRQGNGDATEFNDLPPENESMLRVRI
jgi:hypothetical protein